MPKNTPEGKNKILGNTFLGIKNFFQKISALSAEIPAHTRLLSLLGKFLWGQKLFKGKLGSKLFQKNLSRVQNNFGNFLNKNVQKTIFQFPLKFAYLNFHFKIRGRVAGKNVYIFLFTERS